jgi:hypothetical protein
MSHAVNKNRDNNLMCKICGREYVFLGSHICQSHNISVDEYREKFELNRNTPLCSAELSKTRRKILCRMMADGVIKLKPLDERLALLEVARKKSSHHYRQERLNDVKGKIAGDKNPAKRPDVKAKIGAATKINMNKPERKKMMAEANRRYWENMSPDEKVKKVESLHTANMACDWNNRPKNLVTVKCEYAPCGKEFQKWPNQVKPGQRNYCCQSHRAKDNPPVYLRPENKQHWLEQMRKPKHKRHNCVEE